MKNVKTGLEVQMQMHYDAVNCDDQWQTWSTIALRGFDLLLQIKYTTQFTL